LLLAPEDGHELGADGDVRWQRACQSGGLRRRYLLCRGARVGNRDVEHVVLLSAPVDVLVERLQTRINNAYGNSSEQRDEITRNVDTVEPLLRRGATLELDGQRPIAELADIIEELVTRTT
jgi:hypothetical protein